MENYAAAHSGQMIGVMMLQLGSSPGLQADDDESLAGEYPRHANIARGAAVRDNNAAATENVQNILVRRLAAVRCIRVATPTRPRDHMHASTPKASHAVHSPPAPCGADASTPLLLITSCICGRHTAQTCNADMQPAKQEDKRRPEAVLANRAVLTQRIILALAAVLAAGV